jgi:hypothetical protein
MTIPPPPRGPILPMPRTRRGKTFFALGLVIWFLLLMSPCALFWFASGGELILHHANIPDPVSHPLLQIGTISESDYRGLRITTSYVTTQTETNMCVETHANYLLWRSRGESPNTAFCDCYARANDTWQFTTTTSGVCSNR